MTLTMLKEVLLWCSLLNLGFFILSFLIYRLARNWIFHHHGRWYHLSEEKFDATYYAMMVFFKTAILFFNIVPYLALTIIS